MIHLVGVEHKVQWRQPTANASPARQVNWARYTSIIEGLIRDIKPSVVAEELNQEILDKRNHAKSILLAIKKDYEVKAGTKIQHIFAEPCSAEKNAKGYKEPETIKTILTARMGVEPASWQVMAHVVAHQHPIREMLWLDAVKDFLGGEMIFVCGDIHLDTFPTLLAKERIDYKITERRIGVDSLCLAEYEGLKFASDNQMFSDTNCFCLEPISAPDLI